MTDETRDPAASLGYASMLRDPRWQRRRLQILQRDDFCCIACGGRNSTLTVHHKRYKGKPWEVADNDLQTLCERCHDAIGPHQRGGAFYEWFLEDEWRLRLVFEKCPLCGCDEDESHSGVVAFACGHFFTADLPHAGLCFQWQSSHGCGFPYLVLA